MGNTTSGSLAELQILNYVFLKNSTSILVENGFTEEYFTTYKPHYEFIINYYKKYNQLPSKDTFQVKFDSTTWSWLNISDSIDFIIAQLKEAKLYRDVITDYGKMADLIKAEKTDKAIEMMSEISQKYIKNNNSSCIDLISDSKSRYADYLERTENPAKAFVTTGLPELDEVLGGWDLLNESAMICARTGYGKSWLLIYFAMSAAKAGLRVGYYSGEMEADLIGYRFDTMMSNISNGALTHGNAVVKDAYKHYIDTLSSSVQGHIYCITPDDAMFNGKVTVDKLRAFIEKYDLQMLCIDQFSLLDDQRGARTPREQAVNISKDLRALQRIKKIPILSAVQLNREDTTDKGVSTRNISESDRIGQDATVVLALERKDGELAVLSIIKARSAQTGAKLNYRWDINKGILQYLPASNDACNGKNADLALEKFDDDKSDNVF